MCTEEDDLDLVDLVHQARGRGLAIEIVTGIEDDDQAMLDVLDRTGARLFVLMHSDNLAAARALELEDAFEQIHRPGQKLVCLPLDPTRHGAAIDTMLHQINQIAADAFAALEAGVSTSGGKVIVHGPHRRVSPDAITLSETASLGRRSRARTPELDVTVSHAADLRPDETTQGRRVVPTQRSRQAGRWLVTSLVLVFGLGAGAFVAAQHLGLDPWDPWSWVTGKPAAPEAPEPENSAASASRRP